MIRLLCFVLACKNFFVGAVDLGKSADKAAVKATAARIDVLRHGRGVLFQCLQTVISVDLPTFQKADVDGVLRAKEGAAHAHVAAVRKFDLPVPHGDILFGAAADAQAAQRALFCIDAVEERVDRPADLLDADRCSGDVVDALGGDRCDDAVFQIIAQYLAQFSVLLQNFAHEISVKAEVDIVGHHKVIFAHAHRALPLHAAEQDAAGSVVHRQRLAAVFINEIPLPRGKAQFLHIAVEGQGRIEAVDGVPEPDEVVPFRRNGRRIGSDLDGSHAVPMRGKRFRQHLCQIARVISACVIDT